MVNLGLCKQMHVSSLLVTGLLLMLVRCCSGQMGSLTEELCPEMMRCLSPLKKKKTAIFECEFLALFCAMLVWSDRVGDAVVFYTDNNAVRDVMISCSTNNGVAKGLLVAARALEGLKQISMHGCQRSRTCQMVLHVWTWKRYPSLVQSVMFWMLQIVGNSMRPWLQSGEDCRPQLSPSVKRSDQQNAVKFQHASEQLCIAFLNRHHCSLLAPTF